MHAEIQSTQAAFFALFQAQRAALAGKPRPFLEDLLHEAEELRSDKDFSVRASAEINRAAATLILGK